jgi:hypothetical protein
VAKVLPSLSSVPRPGRARGPAAARSISVGPRRGTVNQDAHIPPGFGYYVIAPEAMAGLDAIGVEYAVLNDDVKKRT